jgi:hypothetical protein
MASFMLLPESTSAESAFSLLCAIAGALGGFSFHADADGDGDLDVHEAAALAHGLLRAVDFSGNGQAEASEAVIAAICGAGCLALTATLHEVGMKKLKRGLYKEIKQSANWPEGFKAKKPDAPNTLPTDASRSSPPTFRRSHSTGTWAVYCPEIGWDGQPYSAEAITKWLKGKVNDKRESSPPGWGGAPSQWLEPVHERAVCQAKCPFCPGQEQKIKKTVLEAGDLKVVVNKE